MPASQVKDVEDAPDQRSVTGRALSALRNRQYRLYFISGLGMTAAQGIEQLVLPWLVLDITGSLGQLGLVIFARGVPTLAVSLFGGVIADRYNRTKVLMGSQAIAMVTLFALAGLTLAGRVEIWHVYASSMLLGVTMSLSMPARQALVRGLVEPADLMNAVALNSMQQNASRIIWPTMAGGIIVFAGVGSTLILCAACYVVGIGFLLMVRGLNMPANSSRRSPLSEIAEGLKFSFATPHIAPIMLLSFSVGSFGLAYMQLGAGFAREELGLGAGATGLFIMASGIGALLGSTILLGAEVRNRNSLFVAMCFAFAISLLLISINPWTMLAFLLMGLFGAVSATLPVLAQAIFQVSVPNRLLGRVVSVWMISGGLGSISALPLGAIGELVGLRWALGGVSVLLLVFTFFVGVYKSSLTKAPDSISESSIAQNQA